MALTGSNLQAAVLWVGTKLKALLVICSHDSFDVFKWVWAKLRVSQEFVQKQEAIYEDQSCYEYGQHFVKLRIQISVLSMMQKESLCHF